MCPWIWVCTVLALYSCVHSKETCVGVHWKGQPLALSQSLSKIKASKKKLVSVVAAMELPAGSDPPCPAPAAGCTADRGLLAVAPPSLPRG